MAKIVLTDLNLNKNEIQNVAMQSVAGAPSSPVAGQFWFDSTNSTPYYYDGTEACAFGTSYTLPEATADVLGGVKVGTNISVNSGKISVADASTSTKGVIEIATDQEVTTGTSETLAVNPKQLATKVTANTAITAATKCKITYDAKGLVTAGADLQASDIPNLTTTKINALTDYVKGSSSAALATTDTLNQALSKLENQIDKKATANTAITAGTGTVITYDAKGFVTSSSNIGIDSGSSNYLSFSTSTYKISANVDTTVGTNTNYLVTSGAVKTYVDDKLSTTYKAKGSVAFADRPTPGSSYEGFVYNVTDAFTTDNTFVEGAGNNYPAGTNIVCINTTGTTYKWDVLAGFVDTSAFITASSTATFTNKTFDANGTGNSISNIETADFATGVLQTTVRATSSASDTALASEKAIATALAGKQANVPAGTSNNIVAYSGTEGSFGTLTRTTSVRASSSASDTYIPTEKAVATFVETALTNNASVATASNPALTTSGGICTWNITTTKSPNCIVTVRETTSGEEVIPEVIYGSGTISIKMNSSTNISAGTYTAVVIG